LSDGLTCNYSNLAERPCQGSTVSDMLEITPDDISKLNDEDLRSLIALLSEAELRRRGVSVSGVTWGGDQNAPDGGLDVRVSLPKKKKPQGFIPRPLTGFQVKKSDMPPKAILKEMRPGGKTRAVISELAKQSGAYIIVSSKGSASDSALKNRRGAMLKGAKGVKNACTLHVDFYDRTRVATWVRDHPGLIPWVRERIGKPLQGWRSFGPWANSAEDSKVPYLLDDKLRVHTGKREKDNGLSAADGLNRIRDILREPRKVVRIVGLSGVGKTRFVQALFDGRVGKGALDPSHAIYTNMSDNPDPQPVGMASELIASNARAILVIDNCTPDLHRRLTEACRAAESLLSVVTVEYDIRDDAPEETDVFRLQPSSEALIEKLLRARFRSLSVIDARRVAEFSGGNARIAISLAGTIGKNETVAGLTNEELFSRLFEQRHGPNASLLLIGQACSLVYSFQGEALTGAEAELPVIAALTGKSVNEIHQGVAELLIRDLVQQRGVWRAVLPHAIANRLAEMALQSFPMEAIDQHLVTNSSDRLRKSFSRRLGYLHESKQAVRLVEGWLSPGGMLGDVSKLTRLGTDIFDNVAPVAPVAVLSTIDRAAPESLSNLETFTRIVRLIAYDTDVFERSARLLLRLEAAEKHDSRRREAYRNFSALFFVIMSGTRASVAQRLALVEQLLQSNNPEERSAGIHALRNMLEAVHISSSFSFDFGARPRNYGYWPKSRAEFTEWFESTLKLVESIGLSDLAVAEKVRSTLAQQFRGLWTLPSLHAELDRICRLIGKQKFWREGWIAVCQTLQYDGKGMKNAQKTQLKVLEQDLRPRDLVQNVRAIVLSTGLHSLDLDDFDEDEDAGETIDRPDKIAIALGKDVAHDETALMELAPELTSGEGRLWLFGRGLATAAPNPKNIWNLLVAQFCATADRERNAQVLRGFLQGLGEKDLKLADALLDAALFHKILGEWFPELQAAVPINHQGVNRLHASLAAGEAPIWQYRYLSGGRVSDPIPGLDLKTLLSEMSSKDGGFDVAVEILYMRLFSDKDQKRAIDPALIEAGRALLKHLTFTKNARNSDHRIGSLIKVCLSGADGIDGVKEICAAFLKAIAGHETYGLGYDHLLKSLFKVQPLAALDGFFDQSEEDQKRACQLLSDISHNHENPLDFVASAIILAWCDKKPAERYPLMAKAISIFAGKSGPNRQAETEAPALSWSETALALLDKAPKKADVLKKLVRHFRPMSWSGSRAAIMEARLPLLKLLEEHPDAAIVAFAKADGQRLKEEIAQERKHETERDKATDERFE